MQAGQLKRTKVIQGVFFLSDHKDTLLSSLKRVNFVDSGEDISLGFSFCCIFIT